MRELKGFQRITLAPHEKRAIHFALGTNELSYWSTPKSAWVEEAATFDVWVGEDATAKLHGNFKITQ